MERGLVPIHWGCRKQNGHHVSSFFCDKSVLWIYLQWRSVTDTQPPLSPLPEEEKQICVHYPLPRVLKNVQIVVRNDFSGVVEGTPFSFHVDRLHHSCHRCRRSHYCTVVSYCGRNGVIILKQTNQGQEKSRMHSNAILLVIFWFALL